ncbi:39S ribosomal protein L33 like protein [Argiope bruennichi]|uniref:39S ribosomal protein L33, mitochondrial n=1 Tax=Argiope bruennichi TaxID=94029 RepID=A0A8T0E717_ARGBR|nr:39S ribosomal protein L33 like protein [Argiope bruennichi]
MAERNFQLRGWESTCLKDKSAPVINVLGLQWDKGLDTLGINMNSLKELCVENVTKKTILSAAHRIFDPIGATCPVALFPKLLLQKTWERKLNWEEEVDSNTREEFLKWMRDIFHLEKVQIPRHLKTGDANDKCSLHFFSDASMYAYTAVAFLRVETSQYVKVQLLSAKARVSPKKEEKTTIARLELLAATITARLASSITKEITHEKIYLWSDSTTVITWIKREYAWTKVQQEQVTPKVQQQQVTPKVQQEQAAHEVSQTRVLDPEGPISETVKTRSGRIVHGPKRLDFSLLEIPGHCWIMAKAKTTHILVLMKSMVTKHKFPAIRPRQAEQLEMIKFDPYVRRDVLYKEMKKIKGVKT